MPIASASKLFHVAVARWHALAPSARMITAGGSAAAVLALGLLLFAGGRSCGERADVEARVAVLASANQVDATSGRITVSQLSERTKKLNAAATAFETAKDLSAYCDVLDKLDDDFNEPF